jgi:hypothetical protein
MPKIPNPLVNGIAAVIALAGGLCLGVLDLQTSEVVMTLGVLFVFNMALGAAAPRGGWYWPALTAIGILFLNWYPRLAGLESNPYLPRTFGSYLLLTIILLVAGLAGMLFGVVVRRTFHAFPLNP